MAGLLKVSVDFKGLIQILSVSSSRLVSATPPVHWEGNRWEEDPREKGSPKTFINRNHMSSKTFIWKGK